MRLEFGGVDIMEGDDRKLWLAEVNFPCYFADEVLLADAGAHAGAGDIAGAIVDYLVAHSG